MLTCTSEVNTPNLNTPCQASLSDLFLPPIREGYRKELQALLAECLMLGV